MVFSNHKVELEPDSVNYFNDERIYFLNLKTPYIDPKMVREFPN